MMQIQQEQFDVINASKMRVGIVTARFNREITDGLLESALSMLAKSKVKSENIQTVSVAGSVEIAFALQKLARMKKYDCLVALGCVIRGETPHFEYVCKMAQEGVLRVMLDHQIPIGFGIITTNSLEQAQARMHVGGEAVRAALELVKLEENI